MSFFYNGMPKSTICSGWGRFKIINIEPINNIPII